MRKPYLLMAGARSDEAFTFEEIVAIAADTVAEGHKTWAEMEIRHDDGRRWYWEMAGPNVTLKVDTPPQT